jgi:hypothetical protein
MSYPRRQGIGKAAHQADEKRIGYTLMSLGVERQHDGDHVRFCCSRRFLAPTWIEYFSERASFSIRSRVSGLTTGL